MSGSLEMNSQTDVAELPDHFQNWPEIRELPALSGVASQIIQYTSREPFDWDGCIKLFASDAGLSAKLLKLVNSSYYGLRRSISSVDRAAQMLGQKTFRCLALGLAVAGSLPKPSIEPFDGDLFWRDNITRALFGKGMAHLAKTYVSDEVFSSAMLQNMAIPLLLHVRGADYCRLLERHRDEGTPLYFLETEQYGWNHAQLGGWIADKWQFPPSIVGAICGHHDKVGKPSTSDDDAIIAFWTKVTALIPSARVRDVRIWRRAFAQVKEIAPDIPYGPLMQKIDMGVEQLSKLFQDRDADGITLSEAYELSEAE
ncbi:HDOD domain protein [Planctomycetes bacterium Pan216]|uniref:HDOD domain protein n=1 Tax=Kolteria novifilia TaxID=2527975 RepID=A0A518B8X0_9BACT|nr:HDOD domain protein [Planctomycetes bacterium Pan216]